VNELLPAGPLLTAFLVASLILPITPGRGVFSIVVRAPAKKEEPAHHS
jgi:hypothetical protein